MTTTTSTNVPVTGKRLGVAALAIFSAAGQLALPWFLARAVRHAEQCER